MTSPWDRRLGARAAAIGALALGGGVAVILTTDDGSTWARRTAMAAAVAPLAGALGALVAIRRASARGELRALEALGASPFRASLGAALGGAVVGLAGSVVAQTRFADLTALFPTPAIRRTWVTDGPAAMRELVSGLRVAAGAGLEQGDVLRPASPVPSTFFVVPFFVLAAFAAPLWIAARFFASNATQAARAVIAAFSVVVGLVAFQAVAAGRAPALLLLAAPLFLGLDAAIAAWWASRGAR